MNQLAFLRLIIPKELWCPSCKAFGEHKEKQGFYDYTHTCLDCFGTGIPPIPWCEL